MSGNKRELRTTLNGQDTGLACEDSEMLLDVLRDELGLTGAKRSCDVQICGACTVLLDGKPVSACSTLAYEADEATVETVEGLATGSELHPVQRAFIEHGAFQCGFCTPGMIMTIVALLRDNPNLTEQEMISGLEGNICRCTGYVKIAEAALAVLGSVDPVDLEDE